MNIKSLVKTVVAAALVSTAYFVPNHVFADVLAGWDAGPLSNWGPSPWTPTVSNPNLTYVGFTRGSGVNTNATAASFAWGAIGWTNATSNEAGAISSNQFVFFSVTANPGYTVSFTNISIFSYRRSATGPSTGTLQYQIGGGAFIDFTNVSYTSTSSSGAILPPINLANISDLQNVPPGTTVTFRIVNYGATGSAGTWYIYDVANSSADDFEIQGTLVSAGVAPTNLVVTPSSLTTNAGATATFKVVAGGDAPTYTWYQVANSVTNLIPSATTATLTLPNLTAGNDNGQYFVVLSNNFGTATSGPVSLTVTDPAILVEPSNEQGLLGSTTSFIVSAAGTSLTYQWYYADANSNILSAVSDGTPSYSSSTISGSTSAALTIAGLTVTDPTNFIVVVSNGFGNSITSTLASLVSVGTTADLAFWNFNGNNFSNNIASPPTYYGIGTASGVLDVVFSGAVDPADGAGLPGFGLGGPPYLSWGSETYPPQGTSNKMAGVQFMTSTVNARNIRISYDARGTGTASDYERLQYTTDGGATWTDYPASTTFGTPTNIPTVAGTNFFGNTGYATSSYASFNNYDLTGFPGVDNNPEFGIRIVTEWQSTATYGATPNTNYYGISNFQEPVGTLTYDLVTISGTLVTNNSAPPVIAAIANTNVSDFQTITVDFTVTGGTGSADNFQYFGQSVGSANATGLPRPIGAVSLDPSRFQFGGSGQNRTVTISPFQDRDGITPVLISATDTNTGQSATAWFYLNVQSLNAPPTNSLAALSVTNTLAATPITIPFTVTDDHTASNAFTYSATSANNTLVPNGNISFINTGTAHPSVVVTPATGQLGVAQVSVTVTDDGVTFNGVPHTDVRSTTTTFDVEVRPNTNVVLVNYFNYDASGSLSGIDPSLWLHLSGNAGQMQVGGANPGYVTIDTLDNTENLQAKLIGAPYSTNSAAVLYASFIVNMLDPTKLPTVNGSYFAVFNDGGGSTANVSCRVMAATNGAAPGNYRLGISNGGADSTAAQMFPMDLVQGSDYVVVVQLVVSNNFSTLWINPSSPSSTNVTDTNRVTTLFNVSDFELRQSGANAGAPSMARLKVGTTFDSVLPSLQIAVVGGNAVLTASDPTLGIQTSTNDVTGPYIDISAGTPFTNSIGTNTAQFYRFGQ